MIITQRQASIGLLIVTIGGTLFLLLVQVFDDRRLTSATITSLITVLVLLLLLLAYLRGWRYARHLAVLAVTVATALQVPTGQGSIGAVIPPVLALVLVSPAWVVGSAMGVVVGTVVRAGLDSAYLNPVTLAVYVMAIGGLLLSRMVLDSARLQAERQAHNADEQRQHAQAQRQEIERQASALSEQNAAQQRLLNLVATLEAPAVALAEGLLLAPIVGKLDQQRAHVLTERLLQTVYQQRTQQVVLDIAGVIDVDATVANALLETAQALRLLGCRVAITGISPDVAAILTQAEIDLSGITVLRSPQDVLTGYFAPQQRIMGR